MTYFGARHALETLSQLWGFDDGFGGIISPSFIILDDVIIDNDGPEFPHRGVLIDTCRNYIDKVYPNLFLQHMVQNRFKIYILHLMIHVCFLQDVMLKILDGMSFAKVNTWFKAILPVQYFNIFQFVVRFLMSDKY